MTKNIKFLLVFLFFIAIISISCSKSEDPTADNKKDDTNKSKFANFNKKGNFQMPALPVTVKEIISGTTAATLTTSGRFISERKAQVICEISEKVTEIHYEIGDFVEENAVMLTLDHEELKLEVKRAEFEVEQVNNQLKKSELLYNKAYAEFDKAQKIYETDPGIYTEEEIKNFKHTADSQKVDVDSQKISLKKVKLAQTEAERKLKNTQVKAPISGIVVAKFVEENENVGTNQKVFEIESTDELKVEVELTEVEANKVFVGQNAVLMNSNGSFVFFGQVTRIAPKVDETKGLLKITLNVFAWKQWRLTSLNSTLQTLRTTTLPLPSMLPNCDFPVLGGVMLLRPGMFVNVHIALSLHKDVVMVPKDAVNYDQDRPYIFIVGKDMKARKQYLTLDHEFSTTDAVEVIEGLEIGELVVIRQSDLKNGSLVQIINGK